MIGFFLFYLICTLQALLLLIPKFFQFRAAKRLPAHKRAREKRRISLVIPARNESKIIGELLDSIDGQTYPREYFSVNIIVDSEDDPTVALAKERNAKVFVVPRQRCKGDALDGFFRPAIKTDPADAFVIVDADAVLSENYLEELNNALEYDRQIFTTRKLIKNYLGGKRSIVCNCSALIYPMNDDMGNTYRAEKNMPLNFIGQGLMLRREVIEQLGGWPYRTLTEDFELKMDSLLKGFSSMYYPHAVLFTEEATGRRESRKRQLRWLTGYAQCSYVYKKEISRKFKEEGADFATRYDIFYFKYPIIIYLAATIITMLAGVFMFFGYITDLPRALSALLLLTAFPFAATYFILFFYGLMLMKNYRAALCRIPRRERACTALVYPLFLLELAAIYPVGVIRAHMRKSPEWVETEREAEV